MDLHNDGDKGSQIFSCNGVAAWMTYVSTSNHFILVPLVDNICCYQWLVTCEQLICHWGEGEMGLHLKMAQSAVSMACVSLGGYCIHVVLTKSWLELLQNGIGAASKTRALHMQWR
ncbi:uncharacterized protein LOC110033425 isoform X2 [Phalaenopsis equestris]|uniref:uncharacterized protein LOC110033425 isoform X2 n=1 Tax=Phalaenopsis equestris TaxID=78828 RepID=UPI0009E3FDDD|nr:uncharacterized protein LOC110033425 isoform X2 [Phalaenopsis equestris]